MEFTLAANATISSSFSGVLTRNGSVGTITAPSYYPSIAQGRPEPGGGVVQIHAHDPTGRRGLPDQVRAGIRDRDGLWVSAAEPAGC